MIDYNIIFGLILITVVIIGYLNGATTELIKVIRLYLPFVVVYFIGGPISRIVYNLNFIKQLFQNVKFMQNLPYRNTIVMLLCSIIIYFVSYIIIRIITSIIKNILIKEVIVIKLGKFNNFLGAIIACTKGYIIISLLVLTFNLLGLTDTQNFTTKLIRENSPLYTQIDDFLFYREPLNTKNSLSNFLEVFDTNQLQKKYALVTSLDDTFYNYNNIINNSCSYSPTSTQYPYLYAFINNPATCNIEETKNIISYQGLIKWVVENNIPIDVLDNETLIQRFVEDFSSISNNTTDQAMKTKLIEAKEAIEGYLFINNWLKTTLGDKYKQLDDLQNDENLKYIIEQLLIEKDNKNEGLIYNLSTINNHSISSKIEIMKQFLQDYADIYEPIMRTLPNYMEFKYKLIAATIKKDNYLSALDRSPLISMYIIDTLEIMDKENQDGESVYQRFIKIMIPLYVLETDSFGNVITFSGADMERFLTQKCSDRTCSINDAFDRSLITDEFFFEIIYALTEKNNGKSYLEELVEIKPGSYKPIMDKEAIDVLANYFSNHYANYNDKRLEAILNSFSQVGDN